MTTPRTVSNPRFLCLILGLLAFAGCKTSGLGTVPGGLVELYDQASPTGTIEIEIDRDGSIREMEADIATTDLPQHVLRAAETFAPGATITGAEREIQSTGETWEVKFRHQGRDWELVVDNDGNILEKEKGLLRSEAPAAVLDAADRAISGGTFQTVEIIEREGGDTEYHVKKTKNGASYKIVLSPKGKVLRKVREARAEIEIPLRD